MSNNPAGDVCSNSDLPLVLTLTPEQSAKQVIKLQDCDGASIGVILRSAGVVIFYTANELAELKRRAEWQEMGRSYREVMENAIELARNFHDKWLRHL